MAAPNKKQKKINLLVKEGFEHTALGRGLNWVLSAGRIIVILTELVVIIAFLSRFWLDTTRNDLKNQNSALKFQVEENAPFETEFRKTQKRLDLYQRITGQQAGAATIVQDISSQLPTDVSLESISFTEGELTIRGLALSESGLAGFIKALNESQSVEEARLSDVSLGTSLGQVLSFTVRGDLEGFESGAEKKK